MNFGPAAPACRRCGAPSVVRRRKDDEQCFIGCSRYPECKEARSTYLLPGKAELTASVLSEYLWFMAVANPKEHGRLVTAISAMLAPYTTGRLVEAPRQKATAILDIKEGEDE